MNLGGITKRGDDYLRTLLIQGATAAVMTASKRTDRRWRRHGLARALVVRSLRAQRDAGMLESELGVDSERPTGATRVYEDCGFVVTGRNTLYRQPLVRSA